MHESSIEIGALDNKSKLIPLILGPLLALGLYFILPETYIGTKGDPVELTHAARACVSMVLWMAIWWFTEAVPIAVTALLPIVTFPLFGVGTAAQTLKEYSSGTIYLFMGGFLIAAGIARWGLDRRIALYTIRVVGTKPRQIVLGVMLATAFLSAWVSNTATAAMMLPIAMALLAVVRSTRINEPIDRGERNLGVAMLLSVAYGASLGGIYTLIGTPPNGIFARFVESNYGMPVDFSNWLLISFPTVTLLIIATYLLLVYVLFRELPADLPGGREWVANEIKHLGPMSRGEWTVLIVFVAAALLWTFGPMIRGLEIGGMKPFKPMSDTVIAMGAGIILFIIPVDAKKGIHALDWSSAAKGVSWDVLLLFGGGLSMAAAIQRTGAADAVGALAVSMAGMPDWAIVGGLATLATFASEFTSNTALAATLMPMVAAIADSIGANVQSLLVAATIATSCAFMMPVGTPPNAMVFGTGRIKIGDMIRAGIWLNIIGVIIITVMVLLIDPGILPEGAQAVKAAATGS